MTPAQAANLLASLPYVQSGRSAQVVGIAAMTTGIGILAAVTTQVAVGGVPYLPDTNAGLQVLGSLLGLLMIFAATFVSNGVIRSSGLPVPRNPWSRQAQKDAKPTVKQHLLIGGGIGLVGGVAAIALTFTLGDAQRDLIFRGAAVAILSALHLFNGFRYRAYDRERSLACPILGAVLALANLGFFLVTPNPLAVLFSFSGLGLGVFLQGLTLYLRS